MGGTRTKKHFNNSYASDFFGVPDYRTIEWVSRPRHYGLSVRKGFY